MRPVEHWIAAIDRVGRDTRERYTQCFLSFGFKCARARASARTSGRLFYCFCAKKKT